LVVSWCSRDAYVTQCCHEDECGATVAPRIGADRYCDSKGIG